MLKNIVSHLYRLLQEMYGKYKYVSSLQDPKKALVYVATKLEAKLNDSIAVLDRAAFSIESYMKMYGTPPQSRIVPCSDLVNADFNDTTVYSESSLDHRKLIDDVIYFLLCRL